MILLCTLLFTGHGMYLTSWTLFMWEITHGVMTTQKMTEYFGMKYTKLHEYSKKFYYGLYIVMRGFCSPIPIFYMLTAKKIHITVGISFGLIQLQSWNFIKAMMINLKSLNKTQELLDDKQYYRYFWTVADHFKSSEFQEFEENVLKKMKAKDTF